MVETGRREAVRRYFTETPDEPDYHRPKTIVASGFALGVATLALIAWLTINWSAGWTTLTCPAVLIGLAATIVAWGLHDLWAERSDFEKRFAAAEPKPSHEQMEAWLQSDIERIVEVGRQRLNIVSEDIAGERDGYKGAPPLIIVGIPDPKGMQIVVAVRRDGKFMCSAYDIAILYLTHWHIGVYRTLLDMYSGASISESTFEFHYRDITSVATANDRISLQLPDRQPAQGSLTNSSSPRRLRRPTVDVTTRQWFRLTVPGEKIQVLASVDLQDRLGGFHIIKLARTEAAVNAIRAKLREFKHVDDDRARRG